MRKSILIGLFLAGIPYLSLAAALTPAQQAAQDAAVKKAFSDAQTLANGSVAGAANGVVNGTIQSTVNSFNPNYYSYTNTAPESALFGGGNGDTFTAGAGKITACQTGATNPDAFKQQNCDAINYMANQPTIRPQFAISSSNPMMVTSRAIQNNASTLAAASLGFVDPGAVGSFTGCTTKATTTPPTFGIEVCNDVSTASSSTCSIGRTIAVNAHTDYQCNKTINAYQTQNCNKTVIPIVTPTNYCDVAGSATGIGSYQRYVKAHYDFKTRKMIPATYVTQPYGLFDVVFACAGDALAKVTVTISAGVQCHGGSCNSSYYPLTLYFIPGRNAATSGYQAQGYTGSWWYLTSITYNGTTNTVSLSNTSNLAASAVTATITPTGTVGIRNVISWTLNNGCAVQEAAAL